jgi:hypothetical protein
MSARRALATLVERGLIRSGGGGPFTGVVMFDLRELAEWAGAWVPRPVIVSNVACGICATAGVRLVAEGEFAARGIVHCGSGGRALALRLERMSVKRIWPRSSTRGIIQPGGKAFHLGRQVQPARPACRLRSGTAG